MKRAEVIIKGEGMDLVGQALMPEGSRDVPKAKVEIASRDDELRLTIEAKECSALRAALNSFLRWTSVALRVREEVKR